MAEQQSRLDDARRASGRCDNAFRIFGKDFLIHSGVSHDTSLEIRVSGRLHQIDKALIGFRPHRKVGDQATAGYVVGVAPAMLRIDIGIPVGIPADAGLILACGFRRHIRFNADNRFDAFLDRSAPHFVCAMHVAVIGDADGRHVEFFGAPDQIRNL